MINHFRIITFLLTLISLSSFLTQVKAAAPQQKKPEITSTKINDSFWVLHGGNGLGANVGMSVGNEGILLIDAMNINSGQLLLKAIRAISDKPIKFVINTHQHRDHRGGNEALVEVGATIIYPDYLKYLFGPSTQYDGAKRELQFKGQMTLKFNDEIFELFHIKSHTWNDVIVKARHNNLLFTGDNHATSWGPNIGVRGLRSIKDVFSLSLALSDDKTVVVPGHTKLADRNHLIEYKKRVYQWFDYVLTESGKGKSIQQIAESKTISDLIKWFHGGENPSWLTTERLLARVEYTLLADEKGVVSLPEKQLKNYLGVYQLKDGSMVEIVNQGEELYAYKRDTFFVFLMARSPTHFDFNGWNEQERIDFQFDGTSHAKALTFKVNGK
jgi:glyoxylase-like metal-dependent hydrolase (beta-lactamase superfamily II)